MTVKLSGPKLSILLNEDDPEPIVVQTLTADMVAAERTARKHGWGAMKDSPMVMLAFLAWHAARRRKLIPQSLTYETFEADVADIADVSDDPAVEDAPGSPTPPDPGSG